MDSEKGGPPPYSTIVPVRRLQNGRRRWMRPSRAMRIVALSGFACLAFIVFAQWKQMTRQPGSPDRRSQARLLEDLSTCSKLRRKPQDPIGLGRQRNARYIDGHKPTLIQNATVWVGEPANGTSVENDHAGKGYSWITADVLLEFGLIVRVESEISLQSLPKDTEIWDAKGRQLTSGIIDMHSHTGLDSLPSLVGSEDLNELSSNITPFVRSIDGLNPLDNQIQVIKSGGVTTSLILPGSGNNMGGEAFVIKHAVGKPDGRIEISAEDMLADPDRNWRYMKMACGENAKRVYGRVGKAGPFSRMGESWEFRHAFEQAAKLVREQDDWCNAADQLGIENMHDYLPQEIRWESLGAALRGQVHINTHCYTIPDLEAFVDHTNEFKFRIRAFHHAHQTFLVPEILKRAWGGRAPASAIFADNMYYKAESYVGSEYAGKVLWENNLVPVYVSDNPVLNAQHVVFEAAKGYRYGLPYHAALASVTSAPAELLGLGQRIGKIKPGFDADIVVWDSDPLSVGAAPVQVWIDGTAQFRDPVELEKPASQPIVPDLTLAEIIEEPKVLKDVVFTGLSKVLLSGKEEAIQSGEGTVNVAISNGKITCVGACHRELEVASASPHGIIPIKNGYLSKSFTAIGSTIGLNEIDAEKSTDNGPNPNVFSRGIDGLVLGNKKLHIAQQYGVTKAISAPKLNQQMTHHGTSVGFSTGALQALENHAVWAEDVAVHYTLTLAAKSADKPSISSVVGALRHKLLEAVASNGTITDPFSEQAFLKKVTNGQMPLVFTVHSADAIAAALRLKATIEDAITAVSSSSTKLRVVIIGGAESHLVAEELASASVGVILSPLQSYATSWEQRRALTGAPLTNGTAIDVLLDAGVVTAIGLEEDWLIRDLALLAGIAYKNGGGRLNEKKALDLISENVYEMLGIDEPASMEHFVVFEGSPLDIGGRIRAVGAGIGHVSVYA